jgi:sulfopyruvate decarboxylase TPP-binding subunit
MSAPIANKYMGTSINCLIAKILGLKPLPVSLLFSIRGEFFEVPMMQAVTAVPLPEAIP